MANYRDMYFKENKGVMGKYQCSRCGGWFDKSDIDIDHIIPQKYVKLDMEFNLQAMCKHCNRSKGADTDNMVKDLVVHNGKRVVKGLIKNLLK